MRRQTKERDAGLLVERLSFLKDGSAAEFTQSYYRGDIYDFVAELSISSWKTAILVAPSPTGLQYQR